MQRIWGNNYRTTIVCVDSCEHGVLSGRLYHPYLSAGKRFDSLLEFFLEMEKLLDAMGFPQSFLAVRSFADQPERSHRRCRRPRSRRDVRDLFGTGPFSSERQLAGRSHLAGGETGGQLPQCIGAGPADEQRFGCVSFRRGQSPGIRTRGKAVRERAPGRRTEQRARSAPNSRSGRPEGCSGTQIMGRRTKRVLPSRLPLIGLDQ